MCNTLDFPIEFKHIVANFYTNFVEYNIAILIEYDMCCPGYNYHKGGTFHLIVVGKENTICVYWSMQLCV